MAETTKKTTATTTLPKSVFAVDVPNHELLKLAYEAYLANGRANYAKTLKRGEVRGGGKKPWRQKGTGRARFGSSRNPIWRGGGIAFGPTGNENYSKTISTQAKRVALRQALTLAAKADKVVTIDTFSAPEGRVKEALSVLNKHNVGPQDSVLLVLDTKGANEIRATRNLQQVKAVQATYLNVFDIMNADKLLVTKQALSMIEEWLGGK